VRSQPIALSVRGASVVGARDVVAYDKSAGEPAAPATSPGTAPRRPVATIGADLSLGDDGQVLRAAITSRQVAPLVAAVYALSLALLGLGFFRLRTRAGRAVSDEIRRSLEVLERALEAAASSPARDSAPRLSAALSALARALGEPQSTFSELELRLESAGYDPMAADRPLDAALRAQLGESARRATERARSARRGGAGAAGVALLLLAALAAPTARAGGEPRPAPAATRPAATSAPNQSADLDEARALYRRALAEGDLDRRAADFARAEGLLGALVERYPDRPELLTDWGNAALGARDFGKATLAYRRALRLSSGAERARRNLAWVRSAMPEWLPRPARAGAMDSLFFWHHSLSVAWRQLVGALAFALAAMLVAPWSASPERRRLLARLAVAPAVVWLAMVGSLAAETDAGRDAVVQVEGVTLRAADSPGAPAALPQPLPAGAEVTILDERQGWARVGLANHAEGWLESGQLALVAPR
jgi:hypothetical protein